ncbi:MAG TPA: winged helix-turn-helix domain-containing protein [Solirubrobacteraceae bacterium]|nr:winged helix-turn-helix domain-containing protein [Solirubrobacteraceae bacterium]
MPNQEPVMNITDPRWLRAISHPIRIRLLAMLEEEPSSPVILANKLDQPLGTIAYHVRTLYDLGLLKLVSTRQRRGATEHYYQTTSHPRGTEEAWEQLDSVSKQRLLTAMLARANDYASRSAAAGGFDAKDSHLTTSALKLDAKGWTALAKEAKKWLAKAEQIEQEAAARIEANPESQVDVGLNIMLFEALPFSADLPGQPAALAEDVEPERVRTA